MFSTGFSTVLVLFVGLLGAVLLIAAIVLGGLMYLTWSKFDKAQTLRADLAGIRADLATLDSQQAGLREMLKNFMGRESTRTSRKRARGVEEEDLPVNDDDIREALVTQFAK